MDGAETLVTVVVPVYNVVDYLEKCIFSVVNQTYLNLEIIIVDDGSTDGSSQLCDELAKRDKRIKVIHKENGGVVSARKRGVKEAQGEYVLCVDSDDWIDSVMIEEMVEIARCNNADIVTSGLIKEDGDVHIERTDSIKEGVYEDDDAKKYLYQHMIYNQSTEKIGISGYIWNKLFAKQLLKDVLLQMSDSIRYSEDSAVVYCCLVKAECVVVTYKKYYHYVMRNTSRIHTNDSRYLSDVSEWYNSVKPFFEQSKYYDLLQKQLDAYIVNACFLGINYVIGLNKDCTIPYYDLEKTNNIKEGSKIVLYGAGKVGQAYYKQIRVNKTYDIVAWIDREHLVYQKQGMPVDSLDILKTIEYDYVLLAFKYESATEKVRETLVEQYKVEEAKMVWIRPIKFLEKYLVLDTEE